MPAAERRWAWPAGGRRARPGGVRAAAVGLPPGPAVRLQRRRERALRGRRDRHVRAHLQPELLHQPAGLHVPAARGVRARLRRPRGRLDAPSRRTRANVFALARALSAVLGAVAVGLLAWAGARLFDRRVGLRGRRAARGRVPARPLRALRAQRRADAGAAVPRAGRRRRRLHARAAAATTRSPASALGARLRDEVHRRDRAAAAAGGGAASGRGRRRGGGSAGSRSPACSRSPRFLVANPFALLDFNAFRDGLQPAVGGVERRRRQARPDREQRDRLLPRDAHLGARLAAGAGRARRRGRARRARLAARARAGARRSSSSSLFMGTQDRYFARWLLPVYPLAVLLAAYGRRCAVARAGCAAPGAAAAAVGRRPAVRAGARVRDPQRRRARRAPTRAQLARDWMVEHVPAGAKVVIEPVDAGRVGERPRHRAARHDRQRRALGEVADVALAAEQGRHAAQGRPRADRQARGLRAHAVPAARQAVRATAATAGC